MSTRRLMIAYAAWMLALSVAFYAAPEQHLLIWGAVGVSSAAAVLFGVYRYRPRRRWPWYLIAAAILVFCAGDATYNILTQYRGYSNPYPSLGDAFYLAMFPLLGAGVWGLSRSGAAGRDRGSAIDAFIFTASFSLLWWIFLIGPHVSNPDLTTLQRMVSIAYPIGDILILATVGRLVAMVRFSPTVVMLTIGGISLLITDVIYGLIQLHGDWAVGGPVDAGWLLFYGLWGAAALHPSMAELTEPRIVRPRAPSRRRQIILSLMALIPPMVLLVEVVDGEVRHGSAIAIIGIVATGLVLVRLLVLLDAYRRGALRADGVRKASAALVSADDVDGVIDGLRGAVSKLVADGEKYRLAVVMNDGTCPELFTEMIGRDTQVRYTSSLPDRVGTALGGFEVTLVCPLALDDRPMGDPVIGVLLIGAPEASLGYLQAPMEVMASQAALAIERITLSGEIIRRNSEQYFRTLVQNTADVILIVEPGTHTIRYASPSAEQFLGSAEIVGMHLEDLVQPEPGAARAELSLNVVGDEAYEADWSIVRKDGSQVQAQVSARDLTAEPTVAGIVVTLRDVTEERRMAAELTHRAFHDSLTGLANRVFFQERLAAATERAQGSGNTLGILFLDIDDFKAVNDTFGHDYGDRLLAAVGQRLASVVRAQDTAARLGGDEFAALIEEAPNATAVEEVANRIVTVLSEPFVIDGRLVSGVSSIGVATSTGSIPGKDLLRQADLALYVAKGEGKGRWKRYQPELHAAFVEKLELRSALDQALARSEFILEYQPIITLSTGATAGFEALLRWDHPTRGRLLPGEFIEVAEESGLIVPLGGWVLAQAMAAAVRWQLVAGAAEQGAPWHAAPYVSINVSVRQFRTPGFVASVRDALTSSGLSPRRLMLEITESLLLRDDDQVWGDLAELRKLGIRVAIDDFGTGYSSLSYLRHVPLDVVKIDRLFTSGITSSTQQAALVDGIVRLAHTLGLAVIAEGIESSAERDLLERIGCAYGQGFLFARSLSFVATEEWVAARQGAS
ncbi:diguanylate cyclase (GGDEF)-like protein/PAS domain S-box-containing protein [Allocatelliglobosispora scoriae]|uniref:Diguanylate cyclase (GGDEF)-like protein/PAS domain S-box-containing protein n=1 Tax=Allocatelliglobosispora scoriae TaxID=643052 RepID=A0A841BZA3_9ACTN|nr:EAL domain-containing protein [Allocatelliglobosispora scoriae]MBB5873015.1 diguanylate cyclase (GGDEF)-like protein/PAS domain S-box-containing protein [Allocatelliglobosispora scoriae]